MPTPEFILRLRERVGHEPLWLVGTTAVVVDGDRLLLVKRADTGEWSFRRRRRARGARGGGRCRSAYLRRIRHTLEDRADTVIERGPES